MVATHMSSRTGEMQPTKTESRDEAQLRHERLTGVIVLIVIAAIMALMIWLASMSGVPDDAHYEYWMMP
jgi:hypothetical protein